MFDFLKIEDIEMAYEYKDYGKTSHYSEADGNNMRVISSDQNTIRFTIQDNDKSSDDTTYQIILTKEEDKILFKGDFFETPEEWYETSTTLTNECAEIISDDASERMVLRCYLA